MTDKHPTVTMGISIRDWRAMMIFQSMMPLKFDKNYSANDLAVLAYDYADILENASKEKTIDGSKTNEVG